MLSEIQIAENLDIVRARIANAALRAGRKPDEVTLVAVTKGQPVEAIQSLLKLGVTTIGESYVEEALPKQMAVAGSASVKWHMIGHVQGRKAKDVAAHFEVVHSVDSLKLAERLSRAASAAGKDLRILLELNVGGEASKHGWPVSNETMQLLLQDAKRISELPSLTIAGLMCMAPVVDQPEKATPFFEKTRLVRDLLAGQIPTANWDELSMGMSDDFEAAIMEGATMVRIGTAVLGPRINRRKA